MTINEWKVEVSKAIKYEMKRSDMSSQMLSELTGIHKTKLSRIINARDIPNIVELNHLARALNCTVGNLVDFTEFIGDKPEGGTFNYERGYFYI